MQKKLSKKDIKDIIEILQTCKVACEYKDHCEEDFCDFNVCIYHDANGNNFDGIVFNSKYAWHNEIGWQLEEARTKIRNKYHIEVFDIDADVAGLVNMSNTKVDIQPFTLKNLDIKYILSFRDDVIVIYAKGLTNDIYNQHIKDLKDIEEKSGINIYLYNWYER